MKPPVRASHANRNKTTNGLEEEEAPVKHVTRADTTRLVRSTETLHQFGNVPKRALHMARHFCCAQMVVAANKALLADREKGLDAASTNF
mmetsp:Transcript_7622/g.17508  ORF Transcript_7622/g.17508 Transcript_7622/m.17508 type:complete len:90 (-) Transcript_7622:166-435(-)